jgi:hypothetical protein
MEIKKTYSISDGAVFSAFVLLQLFLNSMVPSSLMYYGTESETKILRSYKAFGSLAIILQLKK